MPTPSPRRETIPLFLHAERRRNMRAALGDGHRPASAAAAVVVENLLLLSGRRQKIAGFTIIAGNSVGRRRCVGHLSNCAASCGSQHHEVSTLRDSCCRVCMVRQTQKQDPTVVVPLDWEMHLHFTTQLSFSNINSRILFPHRDGVLFLPQLLLSVWYRAAYSSSSGGFLPSYRTESACIVIVLCPDVVVAG